MCCHFLLQGIFPLRDGTRVSFVGRYPLPLSPTGKAQGCVISGNCRSEKLLWGLKTTFYLICDLEPHHPFENLNIKLALAQDSSEELTPGHGICLGHPVTPPCDSRGGCSNTSKAISESPQWQHPFSRASYGALTSHHANRLF